VTPDQSPDVIVLDGVHKRFGSFIAVERADISIARGEFFAMLGPSGCGKTTTLKMIAGFEQPTSGRVLLEGIDVSRTPPHRRNVNTVFQQYALFPHMTVADNVAFGPRSKKIKKSQYAANVAAMLEVVRLGEFANRKPAQLSGGQQQRVALARALVNFPSALLLDEPLAALDLKLREAMQFELKRIQREVGITFVFVTHDQGEALTMSDRIAVIYHRPGSLFVAGFIGSANLLPGTVAGANGDDLRIDLQSGTRIAAVGNASVGIGDKVSVMLRPERITVTVGADSRDGHNLEATVTDLVFQGASARLSVRLGDSTDLVTHIGADDEIPFLRPGDAVNIGWKPGAAYAIPGWPDRAGVTSSDVDSVEAAR